MGHVPTGMMTLFMLITSDVYVLINYTSFSESLFILCSIAALLWLRYKRADIHRPIKVWIGFPILFFVICLFLVLFPVYSNPVELGIAIAIILTGVPVYYIGIYWQNKPKTVLSLIDNMTYGCQLLCFGLPEEMEDRAVSLHH
ncbi:large neutral amino acids transporter small subunit 2-like [Oratosquilla oratoria]|uniref:large neutral amino acids transporter small subunit 2-like n=1 Tax=Oratosquilla oratoria TaxID=337810 RepID=UPI003F76038C